MITAARWLPVSLAIHAAFGAAVWLARDFAEPALFIDMRLIESDAPERSESLRAGNRARPAAPQPHRSPGRSAPASGLARDTRAASRGAGAAAVRELAAPPVIATPPVTSAPPTSAAAPWALAAPPASSGSQTATASPPSASPAPPVAAAPPTAVARDDAERSTPPPAVAPAPPPATSVTPTNTSASVHPDAGPTPAPGAHARAAPPDPTSSLGDTGALHGGRSASSNGSRGDNGATAAGASTPGGGAPGDGPLALAIPGDAGLGGYGPYLAALRRRLHEALEYPAAARRRGLTGTVELEIALEATGRVNDVRLVRSSSHAVLDAAALEAARGLGRVPFPPDIRPRALRVLMPVVFELR